MIKEHELREAIAECQGERNPNANTCIKLAAYYTILNNIEPSYSRSEAPHAYDSGSEFSEVIKGRDANEVYAIMDELMDSVSVLVPKLYDATIRKLRG